MEANKIQIPLTFNNYKLLEEGEYSLTGSYIYFVSGSNSKGKTSLKNAIATLMTAKNHTDEPVTRGKRKGSVDGKLPGADGQMYDINWGFTNEKDTFILVKPNGELVNKVGEIRDIFKYTHFSVNEFLGWSNSAEGIRKQQKIILNLLPQEMRDKYELFTAQEAETFDLRKDKKKELDVLKKQSVVLPETDESLLKNEGAATERIKTLEKQLEDINKKNIAHIKITNAKEKLESVLSIDDDLLPPDFKTEVSGLIDNYVNLLNEIPLDYLNEKTAIDLSLEKGRDYLNKINQAKERLKLANSHIEKLRGIEKEVNTLESDLEKTRSSKKAIFTEAKLPFDVDMTDEGLTVDGFKFSEYQVCKSKAVKIVAAIMCAINPSPILLLDDAECLDNNSLKELYELAKEKNKIMIFDKVVPTENELFIVGYDETI